MTFGDLACRLSRGEPGSFYQTPNFFCENGNWRRVGTTLVSLWTGDDHGKLATRIDESLQVFSYWLFNQFFMKLSQLSADCYRSIPQYIEHGRKRLADSVGRLEEDDGLGGLRQVSGEPFL